MSEEALGEASSGTTTVVLGLDMMMDEVSHPYRSVLFADVSGSAKLHEKLGNTEALRAAERCMKRMERAVEAFNGRLLRHNGDELMAVFATAEEASMSAIEMQQRVADLPPISGVKLAIRVGFSFGIFDENEPSTGELVDTAAYLTGLAKPGQILTTTEAQTTLSPVLQLSIRDRGTMAAKGKFPEIQLFELLASDSALAPIETGDATKTAKGDATHGTRLRLRYGDDMVILDKRNTVVSMGRDADCDVVIHDRRASRRHVEIEWREDNRFILSDMSTNGTYVTIKGQPEIHLRKEECVIHGTGVICFAASANTPQADRVEFEQF